MKDSENIGEAYCSQVGDFFYNPHIIRLFRKYYRKKQGNNIERGQKLPIWKNTKQEEFHETYYDFILDIFGERQHFQDFFTFMREELGLNIDESDVTYHYNYGQITTAILAMREVFVQLGIVQNAGLSLHVEHIKSAFQTQIVRVIETALESQSSDEHPYNFFHSIERILDSGFNPISTSGEILSFLSNTRTGVMVTPLTGGEPFELLFSNLENIDISRVELIQKIKHIKSFISFQYGEGNNLNTKEEKRLFQQMEEEFLSEDYNGTFVDFLQGILEELLSQIPLLPAQESSQRIAMIEAGKLSEQGKIKVKAIIGGKKDESKSTRQPFLKVIRSC